MKLKLGNLLPIVLVIMTTVLVAGCGSPDSRLVDEGIPAGDTEVLDPAAEPSDLEEPSDDSHALDTTLPQPIEEPDQESPVE